MDVEQLFRIHSIVASRSRTILEWTLDLKIGIRQRLTAHAWSKRKSGKIKYRLHKKIDAKSHCICDCIKTITNCEYLNVYLRLVEFSINLFFFKFVHFWLLMNIQSITDSIFFSFLFQIVVWKLSSYCISYLYFSPFHSIRYNLNWIMPTITIS